ncbi:MAG: TIGR03087 family PEP-CTERM/XrtA system glycosyltransferase [Alphaproteobacteria bacterium]|nr:TIGR03087 family PEP-CTERM/XrtA system glycosyltransferase [Alphaproteobacteria bacterium]
MNILFLCHRIPYPPNKGDKIRAFNILAHLAKSHVVHCGAFVDDPDDMPYGEELRRIARGECLFLPRSKASALPRAGFALASGEPLTTAYFESAQMRRWVVELMRKGSVDRVVIFSTAMAPLLLDLPEFDPARVIFDMVDVDSDKWRQYARSTGGMRSWVFRREAERLFALERRAANAFGATLLVSPFEARTFTDLAPETSARVHAMPNGVDLDYFSPDVPCANPFGAGELPVVMTGMMDYRPNVEGATWFAQCVMPAIREALPRIHFHIVGAKPDDSLRTLGPDVIVTGRVADVRPYLAHAAAVVAPLRLARGIQNKVLEGMAMARPVVATGQASRALEIKAGSDLWVADDTEPFARAVVAAASGPDREIVARNGRRLVERRYNWTRNLATLDRLLDGEAMGETVRDRIMPLEKTR